jgi:hypothetical protein
MSQKENRVSVSETLILLLAFTNAFILKIAFISNEKWYSALIVTMPLLLMAIYRVHKKNMMRDVM